MAHYHLLLRQTAEAIATMVAAFGPLTESANPRWVAWYFDIWFLIAARLGRYGVAANGWRANSRRADRRTRGSGRSADDGNCVRVGGGAAHAVVL